MRGLIIMNRESDLFQVILAVRVSGRLAGLLHGGKQDRDQHAHDGDSPGVPLRGQHLDKQTQPEKRREICRLKLDSILVLCLISFYFSLVASWG